MDIPIQISQIPIGTIIRVEGVTLSADGRWQSEWAPSYTSLVVETGNLNLGVPIQRTAYDQLKSESHEFRVSLALSELSEGRPQRILTQRSFDIPAVGHCWLTNDDGLSEDLACRTTHSSPPLMMVTTTARDSTCPGDRNGTYGEDKVRRNLISNSASDGPFSPLALSRFYVASLCPGTPITFSAPTLTRQYRIDLPLGRLRLREQQASFTFGLNDYKIADPPKKPYTQ